MNDTDRKASFEININAEQAQSVATLVAATTATGVGMVLTRILNGVWLWLAAVFAVAVMLDFSLVGRDATDQPGWFGARSKATLITDHETGSGCQYLSRKGGVTPRLDRNGKHICNGA